MSPSSADFQTELAAAVRMGVSPDPARFPPERLAVYTRLVRNNMFGFINRCFVETPKYLEKTQWTDLLEDFVQNGVAHSPYFQDIAGEFLRFCQEQEKLDKWLLALMNLEVAQLQAEVAIVSGSHAANDDDNAPMQPNASVHIRQYNVDFAKHYPENAELRAVGNMAIWRDKNDWVRWQNLSDIDHILLALTAENPLSLNDLLAQLAAVMPDDGGAWQNHVRSRWQYWIGENVLQAA